MSEYRTARELWHTADAPVSEARTLANIGHILVMVGQTDEALAAFTQALKLLDLEDERTVRLKILDGVGLAYHDLGFRKQALSMFERALRLAELPEEEATIRSRIGNVLRDEGDFAQAWQQLDKARKLAHSFREPRWEAFTLADLAHIDDLRGRDEEALHTFEKAFRLLETLPDPLSKASILFGRAEALRDLGRLEEAVDAIEDSMRLVEPVRSHLDDPQNRVNFFSWRQRYYELYVTLLMDRYHRDQLGDWEIRAFETSDRSRSRSLLDDMAGEPTTIGSTLEEVQRELLDSDTTLLSYALGDRGSFLWVVTRDSIAAFDLPLRSRVEEAIEKGRRSLPGSGTAPEVDELSRMLLPEGVQPLLRKRLLICADGALHAIPFSMLLDRSGKPLIFDHIVTALPSASYLVGMRRNLSLRPLAPKRIAVLADPVFERDDRRFARLGKAKPEPVETDRFDQYLDRLVLSRYEANRILRLFPEAATFQALDFDASRSTAMNPALGQHQMIHITTHYIDSTHPEFTGLMLSRYNKAGQPQNGLLRASEIYELRFPIELVVLSACGSGLGPRLRGEGPMGMTRAFLHAGAKRIVVSLWPVEDDATAELMSRFYRAMLQERLPPSDALRFAQLSMASEPRWGSSRAWAAFVLQGEPR